MTARWLDALAGRIFLEHHAAFDLGFLDAACRHLYGAGLPALDTLVQEARRWRRRDAPPEEGALRLGAFLARGGPLPLRHLLT